MQINLTNCGITFSGEKKSNATGHINLSKGYYSGLTIDPNGGIHDGKNSKYIYDNQYYLPKMFNHQKYYHFIYDNPKFKNNCISIHIIILKC